MSLLADVAHYAAFTITGLLGGALIVFACYLLVYPFIAEMGHAQKFVERRNRYGKTDEQLTARYTFGALVWALIVLCSVARSVNYTIKVMI